MFVNMYVPPRVWGVLTPQLHCMFSQRAEQIESSLLSALLHVPPEGRTVYNRVASCGSKVCMLVIACVSEKIPGSILQ